MMLKFVVCPSCGSTAYTLNGEDYECKDCGYQFKVDSGKIYAGEFKKAGVGQGVVNDFHPAGKAPVPVNPEMKFEGPKTDRDKKARLESETSWIKIEVACEAVGILDPWEFVKNAGSLDGAIDAMRKSLSAARLKKFDGALRSL